MGHVTHCQLWAGIIRCNILMVIFQVNMDYPIPECPVVILHFIGAKDDGGGGDNWSYRTCKVPVKSSPPTNQQPASYRPRLPFMSPNQQWQSTEGKKCKLELFLCTETMLARCPSRHDQWPICVIAWMLRHTWALLRSSVLTTKSWLLLKIQETT